MLLEFTIGNYRSFREDATLSLVSTKLRSRDPNLDEGTRHRWSEELSVLHTAAIYGANASGKSNLIRMLDFALGFVRDSAREGQAGDPIDVAPFLFHEDARTEPTYFEIVFLHDGVQYRYGFEADRAKIHREWLFRRRKREVALLEREEQSFRLSGALKGEEEIARRTRTNALFLSVAAQLDVRLATDLLGWLRKIAVVTGLWDLTTGYTAKCIRDETFGTRVKELICSLDVGICDFVIEERAVTRADLPRDLPENVTQELLKQTMMKIDAVHAVRDDSGSEIERTVLSLHDESEGTQKLFALAGPLVQTLAAGDILVIDEFDARLHPLVSRRLVELFHDPATNPNHAQLVIATHDTNLLSRDLFRRDQVWFVEKNRLGESALYSLASFHVRNDASFEADYFRGRYGAVPFLGGLRRVLVAPDPDAPEHREAAS